LRPTGGDAKIEGGGLMTDEFTLREARELLSAARDMSPDGLTAPFTQEDMATALAAGAEVKSIDEGLLDFPAYIEGQPAYWCWRAGEDDIRWWHPRDTGFAGRRAIEDGHR
jgi:hypothetical protein